jgi:hypothetical protein
VRARVVWVQAYRFTVAFQGLRQAAAGEQRVGSIGVREVRFECNRAIMAVYCFRRAPEGSQSISPVAMRFGELRLQGNGSVVARQRGFDASEAGKNVAAAVMGFREIRLE